MTRRFANTLSIALLASLAWTSVSAAQTAAADPAAPPAYTARAMHQLPDGSVSSGSVVKSGPNMRLEYDQGGIRVIQVIKRADGLMLLLDAASQSYSEILGDPSPDPNGIGYMPPCQPDDPNITCNFKGNETTSGINAEVWEVGQPGQPGVTTLLWDGARHRALRQTYPDGAVMTLTFRAMEQVAGRTAERWDIAVEAPGQPAQSGEWVYDPELRVEIREVLPNGESRWLEDIIVGPVDPALFEAPAGWTRIEMPPAPGQPAAPAAN